MSYGQLKTIKLERTLGDSTLSITKPVAIDTDEVKAFNELDVSIIEAATNLLHNPVSSNTVEVAKKVEEVVTNTSPEKPRKNKKGAGRPKGSKSKTSTVKQTKVEAADVEEKTVAKTIETLANQEAKVAVIGKFQSSFEENIGYTSDDTYEKEFNDFLVSLVSMDYETFLNTDITENQLKTFEALI